MKKKSFFVTEPCFHLLYLQTITVWSWNLWLLTKIVLNLGVVLLVIELLSLWKHAWRSKSAAQKYEWPSLLKRGPGHTKSKQEQVNSSIWSVEMESWTKNMCWKVCLVFIVRCENIKRGLGKRIICGLSRR